MTQSTFNPSFFNQSDFINQLIQNSLLNVNTVIPAKIISVENNRATIEPLFNSVGLNQEAPQPYIIKNVPIATEMGGDYGIIIPYKKDDIVLCVVMQRDISNMQKNWVRANPNSARKFNLADCVIIKNLSNTTPKKAFIKITDEGIEIHADNVTINSTNATINSTTATINANCELGGSGGAYVVTADTTINDSQGKPCTIVSGLATKVKAV